MFKLLVALLSLTGIVAINTPFEVEKTINYEENQIVDNSFRRRNYQHNEWINSYTEVTYKYETNEVNSISDLVVGNIYHFRCDSDYQLFDLVELGSFDGLILQMSTFAPSSNNPFVDEVYTEYLDEPIDAYSFIYLRDDTIELSAPSFNNYVSVLFEGYSYQCELDFVILLQNFSDLWSAGVKYYFSSTDYNVIESVTYHQPETIIGSINEFLETYLYSEIPYVNTLTFEVGGQSINLMTYLIILTGLAIAIGLLLLMIWFIKWLVKLIAYGWTLRG